MKRFIILNNSRILLTLMLMVFFCGSHLQAQKPGKKGKATVKVVTVIDGKMTVEEHEIDLGGENGMQIIEIEEGIVNGGGDHGTRIIRKKGNKGNEVEMIIVEGDEGHTMVIHDGEIHAGGDGEQVFVHKIVRQTEGEDGKMQVHTIKVINGDTVFDDISGGESGHRIFIEECIDGKSKKGKARKHRHKGNDGEMRVEIRILSDEDGIGMRHEMIMVFIDDLDEEETAKYAQGMDNKLEVNKILAYPNPNEGVFNLSFDLENQDTPTEISICSLDGREIFKEKVIGVQKYSKKIDLQEIPAGIYLLRILQGEQSRVKKLVIE